MTRYLFIGAEGFPPTVYDAQVGDLLRVLARAGVVFDVLGLDPLLPRTLLSRAGRARIASLREALPGRLIVRPALPYDDRLGGVVMRRLVLSELRRGPTVVHARGLWAAHAAVRAARAPGVRARVVYDVRGDYEAEHAFHVTGRGDDRGPAVRAGLARIRRAEALTLGAADTALCVSRRLASTLRARHPGACRMAVVPCGHDPAKFRLDPAGRAAWRAKLGLGDDRWVLAYAGSLVPYQLPEVIIRAGALAARAVPGAHLLLLTPDVERARALLAGAGLGPRDATALAAKHGDMCGLLNAADAALLLRRRDPVNDAASPTKLAEYLACGAPVLVSDGIGDSSELVREAGCGRVVADPDDGPGLEAALRSLAAARIPRERVAAVARDRLARDRFLGLYEGLYRGLGAELDPGGATGARPKSAE